MVTQTIVAIVRILCKDGSFKEAKIMYKRKTVDCYAIESKYGIECNCEDFKEARERLEDYRNNVDYLVWIKKWRKKIQEV